MSTTADVQRARELHEAGWGISRIRALMHAEGRPLFGWRTIKRWVDPEFAERDRIDSRARQRERWRRRSGGVSRAVRVVDSIAAWERARDLRDNAGLSVNAVTKVLAHDLGVAVREDDLRYAFEINRLPRAFRLLDEVAS